MTHDTDLPKHTLNFPILIKLGFDSSWFGFDEILDKHHKIEHHEDFQLLIIMFNKNHNFDHTSIPHPNQEYAHRSSGQSLCVVRVTYNSKILYSICVFTMFSLDYLVRYSKSKVHDTRGKFSIIFINYKKLIGKRLHRIKNSYKHRPN